MIRQPAWDQYETALLIEAYINITKNPQTKKKVVQTLSCTLREHALNQGLIIDQIYRNENGINLRLSEIHYLFSTDKKGITKTSRLFKNMVDLYIEDRAEFKTILAEAKRRFGCISCEESDLYREESEVGESKEYAATVTNQPNSKITSTLEDQLTIIEEGKQYSSTEYDYFRWLTEVEQLTETECKRHVAAVVVAERYALLNEYIDSKLFELDCTACEKIVSRLLDDDRFIKTYGRYTKALRKYLVFLDSRERSKENTTKSADQKKSDDEEEATYEIAYRNINTEDEYCNWLVKHNISSNSCNKHIEAVYLAERFAVLNDYSSHKLFEVENSEAGFVVHNLLDDRQFNKTYEKELPLLRRYLAFLEQQRIPGEDEDNTTRIIEEKNDSHEIIEALGSHEDYGETRSDDELYSLKYPELYSKLSMIAEVYYRPQGMTINDICKMIGTSKKRAVSDILDHVSWAEAMEGTRKYVLSSTPKTLVKKQKEKQHNQDPTENDNYSAYTEEYGADSAEHISAVLEEHYKYGFKYDSIRELMRFRQFAEAKGIILPKRDEDLKTYILASGTIIEGKVYCKNDNMLKDLQVIINDILSSGHRVIYYEKLFEIQQGWMESNAITSSDMLKELLIKSVTGWSFSKRFMSKGEKITEKEAVSSEIIRVWGTHQSESVIALDEKLPYIPIGNIWRVISGNNRFALVSEGEYLLIDRFNISEEEEDRILCYVEERCSNNGFASLSDVPMGDIFEENYELTQLAIYNAIYKKVLSDKYYLNGKILTKDKPEVDAVSLLKQHIKGRKECTFDEIAQKVVELTGGTNRQYAFQALYDEMIRIDKSTFVSSDDVMFDVTEIDRILSTFITDHFVAIRDITTFAMFPLCGQNWNHYLLESFCYKYSRKYSLHVVHFNDKNAGIIAEKDYNKSYSEMLSVELARKDVELSPEIIGTYLFNNGYMAKRKYAKLGEIAERAKEIRNQG